MRSVSLAGRGVGLDLHDGKHLAAFSLPVASVRSQGRGGLNRLRTLTPPADGGRPDRPWADASSTAAHLRLDHGSRPGYSRGYICNQLFTAVDRIGKRSSPP